MSNPPQLRDPCRPRGFMDDSAEIERERIIAILRDEQSKCDDELSRMLIERIINRIVKRE